jgi:hypothetical protein
MASIQLNLINQSNDQNNSSVIVFGKNVLTSESELAIAWEVIQNMGQGFTHPFTYDLGVSVSASDSFGNFSPRIPAEPGQQYAMTRDESGDVFTPSGQATINTEIEVKNNLPMGAIDAHVYRSGKLFASLTGISPGQKAVFQFKPTIWIGVASQVEQGQVMNAAILSDINTELSLLGIASADIVMTGGGSGAGAKPFQFNLENVKYA